MDNHDDSALADLARRRVTRYRHWGGLDWWACKSNRSLRSRLAAAVVVPFGLEALLYVPQDQQHKLNLGLLAVSALALVAQVVGFHLRLGQCARVMSAAEHSLENALTRYDAGLINFGQLAEALDRSSDTALSQEGS